MILKTGNIIKFFNDTLESLEQIPKGNWLVKVDPNTGEFFLEKQDEFTLPEKNVW